MIRLMCQTPRKPKFLVMERVKVVLLSCFINSGRTAVDFCNHNVTMKWSISGKWGDGSEAQNSRKEVMLVEAFVSSVVFLCDIATKDWKFTFLSEFWRGFLFASLLTLFSLVGTGLFSVTFAQGSCW